MGMHCLALPERDPTQGGWWAEGAPCNWTRTASCQARQCARINSLQAHSVSAVYRFRIGLSAITYDNEPPISHETPLTLIALE